MTIPKHKKNSHQFSISINAKNLNFNGTIEHFKMQTGPESADVDDWFLWGAIL